MKHLLIACAALFIGLLCPQQSAAQLRLGGKKLNTGKLLNAGADVVLSLIHISEPTRRP